MGGVTTSASILLLALGLTADARAQTATLVGSIADEDGRPLAGAHVYVAGSMQGTITRPTGQYRLERLPLGNHRVVASMVGFEVQTQEITLREARVHEVDYILARAVYPLGEVEVSAREQRRWLRRLERFERVLFGTSSLADSVRLLNPEVLDFSSRFGKLTATARAPLEIENRSLGYRIRYDLTVFEALPHRVRYTGEPLFEELEPRDADEASRWAENRRRAYRGSPRHLLRSMIADVDRQEDFTLIHRPDEGPAAQRRATPTGLPPRRRAIHGQDILRATDQPGEYRLSFRGLIEVIYEGEPEDARFPSWEWNHDRYARPRAAQYSQIYLSDRSTLVDQRGELLDAFGITRMGYFAFRRLAMLLPVEYEPSSTE